MNFISIFLKGFAMGAANVIPGVSGGTIAFVTGIYERLINSIKSFDSTALKLLLGRKFTELFKHTDAGFLTALMLGVVVALLTLARALKYGFEHHPVLVSALFFGLIAASIWSVFKMVKHWTGGAVIGLLIGCAIAVSMAFLPQAQENQSLIYLMICGVVAMCSMIIPGISGSFVLILMGNYNLIMVESLTKLGDMKFKEALTVLIPVGIGAVLGMFALSRLLSWLFRRFHDVAVATITGFVAGSLVTIWPWKNDIKEVFKNGEIKTVGYERYFPEIDSNFWIAALVILVGVILMIGIEMLGKDKVKS
ncbi:MAG: putative membrane protein [Rubritalea sp.]|jgi:putative membrane protein